MTDSLIYSNIIPCSLGRHPNWNVIATIEPTAWFEALKLADDDRLALPLALRKRVTWCKTKTSVPLLATIGAEAEVTIAPLESRRRELEAVGELLGASGPTERAPLAFAAMSTYSQISLQPDGRMRLSTLIADHLRGSDGDKVWAGAYGYVVTLWPDKAWTATLKRHAPALRQTRPTSLGRVPGAQT